MPRTTHAPKPPTDRLTGRWVIERAEPGEKVQIAGRPGVVWAITVRHVATAGVDHVRIAALERTMLTVGQEIEGRLERRRDGVWFKRDQPAVRRR